jgi:threonine synthase
MSNSFVTHLSCWKTGERCDPDQLVNLSAAGKPLRVEYDLGRVRERFRREALSERPANLWAWRELLPFPLDREPPTLGEGATPLIEAGLLAQQIGVSRLWIKDEAVNPTGSFKIRGMAVAVAMAKHLGAKALAVPSAGNAGGALAAFAAAVGLEAHVFMPRDVPAANRLECELAGARVTLVDGLITDCGALVRKGCAGHGWFDVSTLKEPYRIEGKKTMGLEIARQLGWRLPDVILYPTGGGTGLVGMHKAFAELAALGWIDPPTAGKPRFVVVQAQGCHPVVRAFEEGADECAFFENAHTLAAGLRVPKAIGDFIMLDILRKTGGTAVAVSDERMLADARALSAATGVCACPEGGACLAALRDLTRTGWVKPTDEVVLFNTASGLKYAEAFAG